MDNNQLIEKLYDIVEQQINNTISPILSIVTIQEPLYKDKWCNQTTDNDTFKNLLYKKAEFIKAIIDNLLANKDSDEVDIDDSEEDVEELIVYSRPYLKGYKDITKKLIDYTEYDEIKKAINNGKIKVFSNGRFYIIGKQPKDNAVTDRLVIAINKAFPELDQYIG